MKHATEMSSGVEPACRLFSLHLDIHVTALRAHVPATHVQRFRQRQVRLLPQVAGNLRIAVASTLPDVLSLRSRLCSAGNADARRVSRKLTGVAAVTAADAAPRQERQTHRSAAFCSVAASSLHRQHNRLHADHASLFRSCFPVETQCSPPACMYSRLYAMRRTRSRQYGKSAAARRPAGFPSLPQRLRQSSNEYAVRFACCFQSCGWKSLLDVPVLLWLIVSLVAAWSHAGLLQVRDCRLAGDSKHLIMPIRLS